jgi:predicted nucleic acid-binding protein
VGRLTEFFLDSYAIIEYLSGNKKFAPYVDGGNWATSILQLVEVYYTGLRDQSEDYADRAYLAFRPGMMAIDDRDVKAGMATRLRLKARNLNLSYADALGYEMAKRIGAKFLTGDRVFSGLPEVEFVK